MTKTAIIEYNEADEDLLQLLFSKISVKFRDNFDILDEEDTELLDALVRLESLPNNKPYSAADTKRILAELKEMD